MFKIRGEALDLVKLQAEIWKLMTRWFSRVFPKMQMFVVTPCPFCFSIASRIRNVHKFLTLKRLFLGGGGVLQVKLKRVKSLISRKSLEISPRKVWIFPNDEKGINYFDHTPPLFFKVKTANYLGHFAPEKTICGYFQWNACTYYEKIYSRTSYS